jgi:3'(2'), 5'-bisphosphate nucleotidase
MNIKNLLNTMITAALAAGKAILEVYETDFSVEYKADTSPLTLADKRAHGIIKEYLAGADEIFPLLSEEGRSIPYAERKEWDILWIVDPLDGTKEFVKRNGEFTVNIALIKEKKPVAGVIYSPVLDKLYCGSIDMGAYVITEAAALSGSGKEVPSLLDTVLKQGEKLPLKTVPDDERTLIVVASRSHFSGETEEFVNSLKDSYDHIELISAGSSLKMCLVAEGNARIYPRFAPTMEWDTAAGQAIVESAGGKVIHHDSDQDLTYNKENLLNPWFIVRR